MNDNVRNFIDNLIPGNYFITKSMEFTKETTSGTLWYLKKFIVLYYNIFLNDSISTAEGIRNIVSIFENFINSLPQSLRENATTFFFPQHADLRGDFRTFNDFKGNPTFDNRTEESKYILQSKKFYFTYLMQLGGQSGVKRHIKEHLYLPNFCMSEIDSIIQHYIDTTSPNGDRRSYTVNEIKNDYHAALRNERQILFYYGFVHSKSNGSSDTEFSSLTPVGECAINSNYDEFRALWEVQKIKIISQPVTVEINNLQNSEGADSNKFQINYNPYISILNALSKMEFFDMDFYKYVLARSNEESINDVIRNYNDYILNIEEIKSKVESFNRSGDNNSEDFTKELKKYIYGIRTDILKDNGTNEFGICSFDNGIELLESEKLMKTLQIYNQIAEYKAVKYKDLFLSCTEELRFKYESACQGEDYRVNSRTKISWDFYNIHSDKVIAMSVIISSLILRENINIDNLIITNEISNSYFSNYKNLCMCSGINNQSEFNSLFRTIYNALINNALSSLVVEAEEEEYIPYINEYTTLSVEDIRNKIEQLSSQSTLITIGRKRNVQLINAIKSLYRSLYSDEEKYIKCECCGEKTFLTQSDDAYLEYHHLVPFGIADGPDHFKNIYGICPSCHRKLHFIKEDIKPELYAGFDLNNHLGITIMERFRTLYQIRLLKSYHLEFALSEQMINEQQYNEILA